MVSPAFIISLLCSLLLTGMAWHSSVVGLQAFQWIAKEHREDAAKMLQQRSTLVHLPLVSLELLTSFATLIFSVRSMSASPDAARFIQLYGLSFFLLLGIWGFSLMLLRKQRAVYWKQPEPATFRALQVSSFIRAGLWTLRSGLIIASIAVKA